MKPDGVSRISLPNACPWRAFAKEITMNKLILASLSAVALFGVAACSDTGTDTTTTQSTDPAATETVPVDPAAPPATDDTTTTAPAN
jgi:hypothetical protein